ncbi:9075_t:CDS:2 [Diversispora eburnea]|uniref:9075_t:CDS:1 n=1 Tax=Diversispora eburnea TaxID=1213867 RepID=A0A9N8VVI3_9GLOM|nr:9075_t:CDS:2 [Diversispora eburnea]
MSIRKFSTEFTQNNENNENKKIKRIKPNIKPKKILRKLKKFPTREKIWNLPNILTISRLAVSPVIGYFILNEHYKFALGAFMYAGITDLLDGFIARHYKLQTMVGTVMDPLADKILMTIITVTLNMKDLIPSKYFKNVRNALSQYFKLFILTVFIKAPIAAVILGRDGCLILASFYYRFISLPPPKTINRYFDFSIPSAEVNTALQLVLMGATLTSPLLGMTDSSYLTALQYTVAGTTIWSGFSYLLSKDAIRILKPGDRKRYRW